MALSSICSYRRRIKREVMRLGLPQPVFRLRSRRLSSVKRSCSSSDGECCLLPASNRLNVCDSSSSSFNCCGSVGGISLPRMSDSALHLMLASRRSDSLPSNLASSLFGSALSGRLNGFASRAFVGALPLRKLCDEVRYASRRGG